MTEGMTRVRAGGWRARAVGFVGVVAAIGGLAAPAWAHVEIDSATTSPDGVTTVEFVWDHGCDGEATTGLELQLPEGATVGPAQLPAGWSAQGDGRVLRLSGPAIADGTPAGFSLELTGYDTSVEQLVPTVQRCATAEEAWIGASEDANDAAPRIPATTDEPPSTTVPAVGATPTTAAAFDVTSTGDYEATATHSHVPWATIIAVVAGLAVVGAAVVLLVMRSRKATT